MTMISFRVDERVAVEMQRWAESLGSERSLEEVAGWGPAEDWPDWATDASG